MNHFRFAPLSPRQPSIGVPPPVSTKFIHLLVPVGWPWSPAPRKTDALGSASQQAVPNFRERGLNRLGSTLRIRLARTGASRGLFVVLPRCSLESATSGLRQHLAPAALSGSTRPVRMPPKQHLHICSVERNQRTTPRPAAKRGVWSRQTLKICTSS